MAIETALVLFNRDLRVHDHPALATAAKAERTVPLFVFDERLLRSRFAAPNRVAFMLESLRDLDEALRKAGGRLFVRRGDPVREAIAAARECGAGAIHVSADWSAYAQAREQRLARACEEERIEFVAHPGVTVVPPGAVTPGGGDHFKVFSPYHRAWSELPWRGAAAAPRKLAVPSRLKAGRLPSLDSLTEGSPSRARMPGGENEGRKRMHAFLRDGLGSYDAGHDDLAGDETSRLSASLRWGCISPLELAREAGGRRGGGPFVRQLCWRDFHHQVLRPTQRFPAATTARAATAGRARSGCWRPGARGGPATRWLTRRCGSWRRRASCTTGRG